MTCKLDVSRYRPASPAATGGRPAKGDRPAVASSLALRAAAILALALGLCLSFPVAAHAASGPRQESGYVKLCAVDGAYRTDYLTVFQASDGVSGEHAGISYDRASNTVSLDGFQGSALELQLFDMGDDLALHVAGDNALNSLVVRTGDGANGYSHGAGIHLTGDGSLKVDAGPSGTALRVDAGYAPALVSADASVKLSLIGSGYNVVSVANTTAASEAEVFRFEGSASGNKIASTRWEASRGILGKVSDLAIYDAQNELTLKRVSVDGEDCGWDADTGKTFRLLGVDLGADGDHLALERDGGATGTVSPDAETVKARQIVHLLGSDSPELDGAPVCAAWKDGDRGSSYSAAGPYDSGNGRYRWRLFQVTARSVTIDGAYYYLDKTIEGENVEGSVTAPDGYKTNWVELPEHYDYRIEGPVFTQGYPVAQDGGQAGEAADPGGLSDSASPAPEASAAGVSKSANPMSARSAGKRALTFKAAKLARKAAKVSAVKVTGAVGKVAFRNVSGSKKLKAFKVAAKTGRLTVPRNTKKGTYKVRIQVMAAGDAAHDPVAKTVACTVRVR